MTSIRQLQDIGKSAVDNDYLMLEFEQKNIELKILNQAVKEASTRLDFEMILSVVKMLIPL